MNKQDIEMIILYFAIQSLPAIMMFDNKCQTLFLWIRETFIFKLTPAGRFLYSVLTIMYFFELFLFAFPILNWDYKQAVKRRVSIFYSSHWSRD